MHLREHPGDIGAEDVGERGLLVADEGDLAAEATGDGGGLGTQVARADDDPVAPGEQVAAECHGVLESTQHVHAGDALGAGQPARARAGGDDEFVVPGPAAVGQQDAPVGAVEAGGPDTEPQIQTEGLDGGGRP
jgi:hypothetical protein